MEKIVFFCFLFRFFFDFWAKIFQTFGQKTSKICENYFCVSTGTTCGFKIFFLKFWTVLDFLQKPSAWFSKFYLRVQSKNFGRNIFLIFLFRIFRILSENFFRLSAKNLQKVVKTTFCVTRGTICGLKNFLKVLNSFGFSAGTFGMVLKIVSTCPE